MDKVFSSHEYSLNIKLAPLADNDAIKPYLADWLLMGHYLNEIRELGLFLSHLDKVMPLKQYQRSYESWFSEEPWGGPKLVEYGFDVKALGIIILRDSTVLNCSPFEAHLAKAFLSGSEKERDDIRNTFPEFILKLTAPEIKHYAETVLDDLKGQAKLKTMEFFFPKPVVVEDAPALEVPLSKDEGAKNLSVALTALGADNLGNPDTPF